MQVFHHIGIPTQTTQANEIYLAEAKLYVTDAAADAHKIEWLRFEPGSPMPEQLKTTPHMAFMVDDLDAAMAGKEVLIPPFSPMAGLKVGFIMAEGTPIEFMQQC